MNRNQGSASAASAAAPSSSNESSAAAVNQPIPFPATSISNQGDSALYFSTILSTPPSSSSHAIELLSERPVVSHFVKGSGGDEDSCAALYLRAAAGFADGMAEIAIAASKGAEGTVGVGVLEPSGRERGATGQVVAVLKAVGCAAARCPNRSDVSRSGIIPALARIASGGSGVASRSDEYPPIANGTSSAAAVLPPLKRVADLALGSTAEGSTTTGGGNSILTPAHTELLQCCLVAGQYRFASRFVDRHPIRAVSSRVPGATAEIYLRYHYLLGCVRIGCGDFRKAIEAFDICLTTPSRVVSAIAVAAFKKSCLCQCLLQANGGDELGGSSGGWAAKKESGAGGGARQGRGPLRRERGGDGGGKALAAAPGVLASLPAACPPAVTKYLTQGLSSSMTTSSSSASPTPSGSEQAGDLEMASEASPAAQRWHQEGSQSRHHGGGARSGRERNYFSVNLYGDLVSAFWSNDAEKLDKIIKGMTDLLKADGNLGLAHRLNAEMRFCMARSLSNVYEVVSLEKLTAELKLEGVEEASGLILEMVRREAAKGVNDLSMPFTARIDQVSGMVHFDQEGNNSDAGDEEEEDEWKGRQRQAALAERVTTFVRLAERIRALDVSLATSGKYQQVVARDVAVSGAAAAAAGGMKPASSAAGPRGVDEFGGSGGRLDTFD